MSIKEIYPKKSGGGDWLKAGDLKGKAHKVTVSGHEIVVLNEENRLVLSFEKAEKKLLLNATNANTIGDRLGDAEEMWIGESIVMFPTVCMYAGDPNTPCIRVRFDDELSEGSDF